MSSFAKISIRFNADLKQFSSQMQNAQRQMSRMGKKMQSVGKNISIGLTAPIVALGYKSVTSFDKQAKAIAQVEAGVRSTGKAAGFATQELLKMASDLQSKTIFGDEEILQGATAQLLTFTNIAGEQFERTQLAALNLATRLDGDLKSASIQLGKALNDPVANLSALSRSGIQFSTEQKAVIKQLAETNKLADAQTIILNELEKQYGGAAEAAAKAGLGPFKQLSNILGDLLEDFGAIIAEALLPFIEKLKAMAESFRNLTPAAKKIIVVIAALTAAVGPLLVALGFMMTSVIPGLVAAFGFLSAAIAATPIGLIAAAIGVAIGAMVLFNKATEKTARSQNVLRAVARSATESIAKEKAEVEKLLFIARDENVSKEQRLKAVKELNKISPEYLGNLKLETINTDKAREAVDKYNTALLATAKAKAAQEKLQEIQAKIIDKELELSARRKAITEAQANAFKGSADNASAAANEVERLAQAQELLNIETENSSAALKEQVQQLLEIIKLNEAVASTAGGGNPVVNSSGRAKATSVMAGIEAAKPITQGPFDIIAEKMPKQVEAMSAQQLRFLENSIAFNEGLTNIINDTAHNFISGFARMIGAAANGGISLNDIGRLVLETLGNMAIQVGEMAIGIGLAVEGIKAALQSLAGPVAIAAGIALVALGSLAKSALQSTAKTGKMPEVQLANGGLAYGPTTALIGEYANARSNPEVVAPLDKLRNMIAEVVPQSNAGVRQVEFKIRKGDLVASLDSGIKYNSRIGR